MASPTPDTSVLDPKPHQPVLDAGKKAELNGHASPVDKEAAPQQDAKLESKPETEVKSVAEPTVESTFAPLSPEPTVASAESKTDSRIKSEAADKPLLNGNGSPKDVVANGVSEDHTPSQVKSSDEQSTKDSSAQGKRDEEPSLDKSEDVQMTDATGASDSVEPVRDEPQQKTSEVSPSNVHEASRDTEMSDKPSDEPASTAKPSGDEEAVPTSEDASALPTSEVDLHPASLSQLAIETDIGTSPVLASKEVSMTDAPSSKVAREREDDVTSDEPASKRAKTEPKEDEPATPVPDAKTSGPSHAAEEQPSETVVVASADASGTGELPSLKTIDKWEDAEIHNREISSHQRREMRKVIGRVKKTKGGGNFRDAVEKLWPALRDSYLAKVEKPMDLSQIDRNLREPNPVYKTFGDFRKDLGLIFENTYSFNGATHEVTLTALTVIRSTWDEMISIPTEEPARPKAVPKSKPTRESRHVASAEAASKRQSVGPATSPVGETVEAKPRSVPPEPATADRRASTATDVDRPKRTVRAPKPKDIDYTTKPSRKKLKPELQFCDEVLLEIMHPKHTETNQWFLDPVDAEGLNIPEYYSIIKKPMDLGKVSRMLASGDITSLKEFDKTLKLIFQNCYTFNGPVEQANPVSIKAKALETMYISAMKGKDAWLSRYAKANAPATSASNASDDEDEDDYGDEGAASAVDNSKEVEELRAKLDEESKKLNSLFASGTNMSMIEIQQGIVRMVQEALLKAVQSAAESQPKLSKASKKASKPSKSKTTGGSANRKSTGGSAQPKKAGGAKKPVKKHLTAADKDQVASAINDLDYPHLDRAIDIIKKDTGQNENNDGELELDIDQLSNEALLKLWELCKKVLPGFGKDSAAPKSSPEVNRSAPAKQAPKTSAKPKKNKPMTAQEQEARIAQLTALRGLYTPNQDGSDELNVTQGGPSPMADSTDDSDSEEE